MVKEVEVKYLFKGNLSQNYLVIEGLPIIDIRAGTRIIQGYLPLHAVSEISGIIGLPEDFPAAEVRLRDKGGKYFLTVKGDGTIERDEYEKQVDEALFNKLWPLTEGKRVEKIRMPIEYHGHTLEVDYYTDRELILGEIEFSCIEDTKSVRLPGTDVTADNTYKNKNLAK